MECLKPLVTFEQGIVMSKNIDYEDLSKIIAKKAIDEVFISTAVPREDRDLLFSELDNIANSLTSKDINDESSWLPFKKYYF